MLVLSRKPGEKIHIGNNIIVTVLEVKGNRVRVGIEAPRDVAVTRDELLKAPQPAEPRRELPAPDLTVETSH
jgi:carbon storage regulator